MPFTQNHVNNNDYGQKQHTVRLQRKTLLIIISALVLSLLGAQHGPSDRDVYDGKLSLAAEVNTFRRIDQASATVKAGHPGFATAHKYHTTSGRQFRLGRADIASR